MILRITLAASILATSSACGSSSPSTPSPAQPSGTAATSVSIVSGASNLTTTSYSPNPISVAVGGSVTWTNNDTTTHTSTANNGAWSSGAIAPGAKFTMTFSSPGSFPYHCTIHPGMVGTVNVQ